LFDFLTLALILKEIKKHSIMNSKLEHLFTKYKFSAKDCYEFLQIYDLLPDYKKVNTVENFQEIANSILKLQIELATEQEIMFGRTIESIEQRILARRKDQLHKNTQEEMRELKFSL